MVCIDPAAVQGANETLIKLRNPFAAVTIRVQQQDIF